jgi:tetratricopeptide (TPR) repeat protein
MIMKIPGLAGGARISRRVGTVDIVPTILDFLGLPSPAEVQGESLRPALEDPGQRGRERDQRSVYYAEALTPRLSFGWGELRVIYHQGQKYIHGPRAELYDLHHDPSEAFDLAELRPEQKAQRRDQLQVLLGRIASDAAADATHDVDAETRQKLAALGYISVEGDSAGAVIEQLRDDGVPPQERVYDNSLVSAVKGHIGAGRWSLALEGAQALIRLDPMNAFYRSLAANSLLGLDRPAEAADVMEDLDSRAAIDEAIILNVARLLFTDGERDRARHLVESLIEERESGPAHYLLGEMHLELGDAETGRRELEAAVQLAPTYGRALQSLAILLAHIGDLEPAAQHFETLVATYPLEPRYRYNYAAFLLAQQRRDEAHGQLRRATELGPSYWQAHLMLLALELDRGDRKAAESRYRHLVGRCTDREVLDQAAKLMQPEVS